MSASHTAATHAGITIMGGNGTLGGCIAINGSSPVFEDVVIFGCEAEKGGGLHITGPASE
jgi:hypothetical protein